MKAKFYWPFFGIVLVLVLAAFIRKRPVENDFESAKEMIVLRKVAHDVLRAAGDSSSRIPAVQRISKTEFVLPFETAFSFTPDSLVKTIQAVFSHYQLSSRYIVNVKERTTGEVVFGYAMLGAEQDNIVPCLGREPGSSRYSIHFKLEEPPLNDSNKLLVGWAAMGLAVFIWLGWNKFQRSTVPAPVETTTEAGPLLAGIPIGRFYFYPDQQYLQLGDLRIPLTSKETSLLEIFGAEQNQLIDRKRLQKEVWEDEGVIVGRSLDMFVSKLRKKLEADPTVQLLNVHGKGYKLEVTVDQV
ncbi:winged helix-turn-helix domain-containing protein [Flavihumibacter sp. CACIAM 22H1]|uniref:winged helix-turn-helix domain-containing protein n=1 Tax=Flavihumibacter sp. CACIAM 22H1 TaxID=1812911 RepID=UPI0007A8E703|nr:winged helix-turn-helix domain-containing protein [Flavihumibacter sp. CACIAM 22H1]KYP15739.1 MAG: hypothetical protein A1D16_05195 [Flavihumibacter sp. CACIAM 22H1]